MARDRTDYWLLGGRQDLSESAAPTATFGGMEGGIGRGLAESLVEWSQARGTAVGVSRGWESQDV